MINTLEDFRREIDAIDAEVVATLARRFRLCEEIAKLKKQNDIPMMQEARVAAVLARCATLAVQHGVSPELVTRIYGLIIEESCRVEARIMEADGEGGGP